MSPALVAFVATLVAAAAAACCIALTGVVWRALSRRRAGVAHEKPRVTETAPG